ncbi:MAG: penicillin-binding protein 1C, partial [Desulfovibrio sp.]|nr:penicillin-binding protein 1C [Desulfovibrio sp.]
MKNRGTALCALLCKFARAAVKSRALLLSAVFCAGAGMWWAFVPKPPLLDGVPFSARVFDRDGYLMRLGLAADEKYRIRTALEDIAPELIEATLLYEDRHFYRHPGVNPFSVLRAVRSTCFGGRRMGASTITMQVARLRYRLDTSDIAGKLRQIRSAFALERHYSKKEILEAYFNLAPYGGNIEGAGAAARIYFGTEARALTLTESLSLVGVPQNPTQRNPLRAEKQSSHVLEASRARLSEIWLSRHPQDARNAFFHHLPIAVQGASRLPFLAPHVAAEALLADAGRGAGIHTTIDSRLQSLLEEQVRAFTRRGSGLGINNACAVLLHWPDMEIRALVGSADFHNRAILGQVDGTRARRSPGSTLKPFIYALALDQGLIHPQSVLYDAPVNFKGYDPENADGMFRGPLSARDALVLSRNVPAVHLANRLSAPDLYAFLQMGHAGLPYDRERYGLALVLGGGEISPRVLASLYALLANKGRWREPVLFRSGLGASVPARVRAVRNDAPAPALPMTPLLSPEAAALTLDMLRDNPSSLRMHYIGRNFPKLPLYWKTGTSNGRRDAWAAGVFGPYVLVVWVGNFDGSPNPAFVGASSAAVLFLDTAGALNASGNLRDLPLAHMQDLNLKRVRMCADTGDVKTDLCPETVSGWFIPGVSPIADSGIYREILVDTRTGLRACAEDEGRTRREVWAFWPSDLQAMFSAAGAGKKRPPPFGPECAQAARGQAPMILSPKEGFVYLRNASRNQGGSIGLRARADAEASELYWFYEDKFIGRSAPDAVLSWSPPGGSGTLHVLDDAGRSA